MIKFYDLGIILVLIFNYWLYIVIVWNEWSGINGVDIYGCFRFIRDSGVKGGRWGRGYIYSFRVGDS